MPTLQQIFRVWGLGAHGFSNRRDQSPEEQIGPFTGPEVGTVIFREDDIEMTIDQHDQRSENLEDSDADTQAAR